MDQNAKREGALNMENNIITKVVNVTPDMAREWLKANVHNRRVRPNVVDRYARDMADGKWMLTHQGIAFDKNGTLVDGQHRLLAICKANVPVTMMVTDGFDPDTMMIVDTNAGRTLADFVRWQTSEGWINSKSVHSTARFVWSEMMQKQKNPTVQEMIEFMRSNEAAMMYVYSMYNRYDACRTAVQLTLMLATAICDIPLKTICTFFDIINSNRLPDEKTAYNVKAALDAKDWLRSGSRTHRADEAVLQRYFYLFYENKKRVPSDWGYKIIYPITKPGLDAFCRRIRMNAINLKNTTEQKGAC